MATQLELLKTEALVPDGFAYRDELVTPRDESALLAALRKLPFEPFEFHGYLGKRRIVSFGWRYDFARAQLTPAPPIPPFLLELRDAAADFGAIAAERLAQVLVTEYEPGAGIGWHRDKANFGEVIGVSLHAACRLRFRRGRDGGWQRFAQALAPRSAYLLRGSARTDWEHSIPPVAEPRYSVTFRTLRAENKRPT
jgi:alkylated DNA repair dioxygenase AlkB